MWAAYGAWRCSPYKQWLFCFANTSISAVTLYTVTTYFVVACWGRGVMCCLSSQQVFVLCAACYLVVFCLVSEFLALDPPSWQVHCFKPFLCCVHLFQYPTGFKAHLYRLSEITIPVLAWAFLGPPCSFQDLCMDFKVKMYRQNVLFGWQLPSQLSF